MTRLGIVSDTHDLLRPEVLEALAGVDRIVHLGDVCSPGILDRLRAIAPLVAVRGNCDGGAWAERLPLRETFDAGGRLLHAIHDLDQLDIAPAAAGVSVVLFGHSHNPEKRRSDGVLYLNPGSAGPRRFRLPVSLAILEIGQDGRPRATIRRL